MPTHEEIRTPGRYYCNHVSAPVSTICRFHGEFPCFEFSADGFGPAANPANFCDFEPVPTREQWTAARELQEEIKHGATAAA